jgi:hypothetical protein
MAFDPDHHSIDVNTGYQIHKHTGHRIGQDPMPHARVTDETEWPKWVTPHPDHVVRQGDHVSTPHFEHVHVGRHDGAVTVMVHNAEEEARALSDPATLAALAAASVIGA